jgi:hypothetical protein
VGLVSGLLGSKSRGPDQSALALTRIDARITQLTQAMQAGFNQLSAQMTAQLNSIAQGMQSGFNSLSAQIRTFQINTDGALARSEADLLALAATNLQTQINNHENVSREHEIQHRLFVVGGPSNHLQTAGDVRKAAWTLAQTVEAAGKGFCAPAFVGNVDFATYLANHSRALATQKINMHLSPHMTMSAFLPPGMSVEPPDSFSDEVKAIAEQVRDPRYQLAGNRLRDPRYPAEARYNAAAVIHGLQVECLAMLAGFENAPEAKGLGARREVRELLRRPLGV